MFDPTTQPAESSSSSYSPPSPPCHEFTFSQIEFATQNFDESLVIGHGGFGKVYRGTITYGKILLDVAIKRLDSNSSQGAGEFWAEVEMLSKLRHCHLVSLIGYCNDRQEMILVYEYMRNGTLADRLHKGRAPLTWVRRLKICVGAARGLDYLHTGTGTMHGVIHRDVKSSNILLDDNWAAKISDFGLSKIGPTNQPSTYVNTLVRGTFGYFDPDYYQTGRLTRKSDVYAFGVVLLEVLCGKQAVDRSIDEEHWGLATWAQDAIRKGRLTQIVDSNLRGSISSKCLKDFTLLADRCLHSRPKQRPTMAEVVAGLESILAVQKKSNGQLVPTVVRLFRRSVPTFHFSSNQGISGGGTSLKSMDIYLSTLGGEDRIIHRFSFNTIVYATENFSETNKLSSDRYPMYKGRLQNGKGITITQYSDASTYEECMNEASALVKFEHENVIMLLGFCIDETSVYLIYDFASNATLDGLISDPMWNNIDWNKRFKIILGVARGLVYLHNHAPIRSMHRDLKPANILLDECYDPKLSGFWLATEVNETDGITDYRDSDTISVNGYLAPEVWSNWVSTKADVFSFGVLILEIVTKNKTVDFRYQANEYANIIDYVSTNWFEGTLSDIIDPKINVYSGLMTRYIEIGLLCVQFDFKVRPTMQEVVDMFFGTLSLSLRVSEMRARLYGRGWFFIENDDTYEHELEKYYADDESEKYHTTLK